MKKRLAIFGVIAALLMLAACSAAAPEYGTEQTQEQEQIVLHLFHYQGEAEEAYGHVIAAYEKAHPNVKIKSEFLNSENYNSTLDARIAVQDCPDLIGVHPGYAQALPLARAGYLADLSGQPCLENVRESDAETGSLAGSIYAAPTDLTYICTFYNADIFAQYDLPVPTTWQEFLDVCRKLKDEGIEIYFEKENIWTLDSKGELLITIMSSIAQEESRSISENVTWGQRKRFADGKVNRPYKQLPLTSVFVNYNEVFSSVLPRILTLPS